jgi:hypothetical protein
MDEVRFWQTVRLVLMIFIAPPILCSCFITLSHITNWDNPIIGWLEFTLSILVGVDCIRRLPIPVEGKVLSAIFYVPIAGVALAFYSLYFEGIVFGNWL